jgi:hypothetical protein
LAGIKLHFEMDFKKEHPIRRKMEKLAGLGHNGGYFSQRLYYMSPWYKNLPQALAISFHTALAIGLTMLLFLDFDFSLCGYVAVKLLCFIRHCYSQIRGV